ncbi:prepilin-type N-terminal cleavage/methylation domain-containing protein [Acidisoma cellulosilytica]|uniref:Prepilin-type N-terminal cleavage/methylation domain-containing protein n=1 Tax=Acidisoma cellulosilyticum TaxID=2802395 RepID=A0A964E6M3_9PROT|nr:prepilin-type N-terminal cleavage/methylation domain-containing protein [Acidisoma cellulosilyticum]MCB8883158.1 prepilin-type N-terminal cleavage/methylation domain-containing protein [Acidisoma cellulosilyticum]
MRPDRAAGFTLFEVIVAMIIAGLALAALFSGAVTGLRSASSASHYVEALARARSHLAVAGIGMPLADVTQAGDDGGGFRWQLRIRPIATETLQGDAGKIGGTGRNPRIALYRIDVTIGWTMDGGLRQVDLNTQRIGPAAAVTP